jgi:SOS-response transcriptional repressor LexA
MDGKWNKRPGNGTTRQRPEYQADAEGVWDFKRATSEDAVAGFAFTRRVDRPQPYRVVGEENTTRSAQAQIEAPGATYATRSRPNRYNARVKMVAGDSDPAPWEAWQQVSYLKLPVVGQVAAGRYDVTVAYHEPGAGSDADFVLVNSDEIKVTRHTFALRVRGDSMIDNEIDDGDIIIVQAQDWADDGDFVIACLTDSSDSLGFVTLKRFYRHRHADRVVLQPANQSLSPIHILPRKGDAYSEDLDGVKIQGRITAIIKAGGML